MKNKKAIYITIGSALFLLIFYFLFTGNLQEFLLVKKGNSLIKKIENYRQSKGKLPDSLGDIGIHSKGDWDSYGEGADAIYYEKKSLANYIVYFGTSLGESKIYYSDSKKWEDINRPIN